MGGKNTKAVKDKEPQEEPPQECVLLEPWNVSSVATVPEESTVVAATPGTTAQPRELTTPTLAKDSVSWKSSVAALKEIKKMGVVAMLVLLGMNFDSECSWNTLPPELVRFILGLGLYLVLLLSLQVLPQKATDIRQSFVTVGRKIVGTYGQEMFGEFVDIWVEHLPPPVRSFKGDTQFEMHVSSSMDKVRWQVACPIAHLEKMVEFFLTVGAPEDEIEQLKERLTALSPANVGYYIEMSRRRGMDGGWFLLGDYEFSTAIECLGSGTPRQLLEEWTQNPFVGRDFVPKTPLKIERCHFFGRDIGATPPRQTEFRFLLPGDTLEEQLEAARAIYHLQKVPWVSDVIIGHLQDNPPRGLMLTAIAVEDSIVQISLCASNPNEELYISLSPPDETRPQLVAFQLELGFLLPSVVEFRYLMPGFGYQVYEEGSSVHFHYLVRIVTSPPSPNFKMVEEYKQVQWAERMAAETQL